MGRRVESIEHVDASDGSALSTPRRTWHVYNGYEPIVEFDVADTGTGGLAVTHTRDFVWGAGFPEPLHMVDFTDAGDFPAPGQTGGGPEVLTYLHDALGSVIGLTNASGTLVEQYVHDPYGRTYVEDASGNPRSTSHYGNPWQWTGQRFDPTTLQYHFTFRTYSPSLGRWLQRDPLGYVDGVSLYEYAGGSPVVWVDPYGLQAWYEGWGTTFRIFFQQPVDHWLAQDVHDDMARFTRATTQHRQGYLDYVAMVPGPGVLADGVNATLHVANGELGEAALSIAGAVPFGESAKTSKVLASADNLPIRNARRPGKMTDDALEAFDESQLKKLDDQLAKEAKDKADGTAKTQRKDLAARGRSLIFFSTGVHAAA